MGKGDKKSKKGKIFMGTYGNSRPRAKSSSAPVAAAPVAEAAAKEKKPAAKKASK
jgi:30S ribosomal protein S31